jgi:hypothetical protein
VGRGSPPDHSINYMPRSGKRITRESYRFGEQGRKRTHWVTWDTVCTRDYTLKIVHHVSSR